MKKLHYRVISGFLAVIVMLLSLPLGIFADQIQSLASEENTSGTVGGTGDNSSVLEGITGKPVEYKLGYEKWDGAVAQSFEKGTGSIDDPYIISNGGQLMYFAEQVNSFGISFEGQYIKLNKNIDMDMFNLDAVWTPIGVDGSSPFMGSFDGAGHEIINVNIGYIGTESAVSSEKYIGFFGYVKNATVKNCGIYSYKIDQEYNNNMYVGGFVGYVENSVVENCYCEGNINADFEYIDPVDRADVLYYSGEVPNYLTQVNPNGQGVVIDLTTLPSSSVNKRLYIGGDVSSVLIKGDWNKIYTGLNIEIADHDYLDIMITFENVRFVSTSALGAIFCQGDRRVFINSTGDGNGNIITGMPGAPAIYGSLSEVYFIGDTSLELRGGDGSSGTSYASDGLDGTDGGAGGYGVIIKSVFVDMSADLIIKGGTGGKGGNGGLGKTGTNRTGSCSTEWITYDSCKGSKGGTGGEGGDGGNGGNGGGAVSATNIVAYGNSAIYLYEGVGGDGGNGGKGGTGGRGQDGGKGWIAAGYEPGHAGGTGGTGGKGGNGGNGGAPGADIISNIYANGNSTIMLIDKYYGNGGNGGDGGNGGRGGNGGGSPGSYIFAHIHGGNGGVGGGSGGIGSGGSGLSGGTHGNLGSSGAGGTRGCSHVSNGGTTLGTIANIEIYNGQSIPSSSLIVTAFTCGSEYKLYNQVKTWDEAHSFAISQSEHLATITSPEEQKVIERLLRLGGQWSYSIGLTVNTSLDGWTWVDGGEFSYSNWNTGEPSGVSGETAENVGEIYGELDKLGKWNDINSSGVVSGFITEKSFLLEYSQYEEMRISAAQIYAGGFGGFIDASSRVEMCATTVNDIFANTGKYIAGCHVNGFTLSGNLAGINNGTVNNCIVAFKDAEGRYCSFEKTTAFGNNQSSDENAIIEASLLNSYNDKGAGFVFNCVDSQGVVYNNGVSSDKDPVSRFYSTNRAVLDKKGNSRDIVVPEYVFDGKFISSVTKIGSEAFKDHTELITIHLGNNVVSVGNNILKGCVGVQKITIGRELSDIPEYKEGLCLFGLDKLSRNSNLYYEVEEGNKKFKSDSFGILYESRIIPFPDKDRPVEIVVIDAPKTADLKEYKIPETVVKIGPYAFSYNTSLQSVDLTYVMTVGTSAFESATALKTVNFGFPSLDDSYYGILTDEDNDKLLADLKTSYVIEDMAFAGCSSLVNVSLDSPFIQKIGNYAFADCGDGLETVSLGSSIKELGFGTFGSRGGSYPTRVKEYAVDSENSMFCSIDGVLYGKKALESTELTLVAYPTGSLKTVFEIPKVEGLTVTEISAEAFSYAWNLKEIKINDVKIVGSGAFANSGVIKISLGESVERFGAAVDDTAVTMFENCGKLQSITVDKNNRFFSSVDGVLFDKEQTRLIKYPANKSGHEYIVPESVTVIDSFAFQNNIKLTHIEIRTNLANVGMYAFYMCLNLSSIYFNGVSAPVSIGENAFATYESSMVGVKNPRTVIYYSPNSYDSSWKKWIAEKGCDCQDSGSTNRIHGYHFAEYVAPEISGSLDQFYNFVVLDKSGEPVNYIYVQLFDSKESKTPLVSIPTSPWGVVTMVDQYDKHGVGLDLDFDKKYYLRVIDNTGEYYPLENSSFYLDEETKITYITLSSVPTVSGVNVSYNVEAGDKIKEILTESAVDVVLGDGYKTVDINSQTAKINKWCVPTFDLLVRCGMDADSNIIGYYLIQDGATVYSNINPEVVYTAMGSDNYNENYVGKKLADINIVANTENLQVEKDLYVVVEIKDADGNVNKVQTKVNIQIIELDFVGMDMAWLENGLGFTFSPELERFIKGLSGEIQFIPHSPINKFAIAVEEDSFKIIMGVGKFDTFTDSLDDFKDAWKELANNYKGGQKAESGKDFDIDFYLEGCLEIKYKGMNQYGEPEFELTSNVKGGLAVSFEFGSTYVVPVVFIPIRLEGEITGSAEIDLTFVFDQESADQLIFDNAGLELKAGLTLRAGIGCSVVSVGIYGSCELMFIVDIYPEAQVNKFTLSGDVGLYAKYDGLFINFDIKWSIVKGLGGTGELIVFENGSWFPQFTASATSTIDLYNALLAEDNYSVALSEGANKQSVLCGIENKDTDAYPSMSPVTFKVGDLVYLFYYEDLNGYGEYDEYNYQKIVYQTYNSITGEYSPVTVLDDNGLADGAFEIYYENDTVVVAYSQLKDVLTSENSLSVSEYISLTEIKTAVLSDGEFEICGYLTNDNYYDMNLNVGKVNGKITAVWVRNQENSMFGTTENNNMSIWYSVYDNGSWSESVLLADGINTVTDLEIGEDGVVYITDTNNDLITVGSDGVEGTSDRVIHMISLSTMETVSYQEGSYHDVSYQNGEFVYYKENNIYSIKDNEAFFDKPVAELGEDYSVLTDETGAIKAILFVANNESNDNQGSNVYGMFLNDGVWGSPIKLTSFDSGVYVSSYSAIEIDGALMLTVLISEATYIPEAGDDEDCYETVYRVEIVNCEYPDGYKTENVIPEYQSLVPNEKATVAVEITNNGSEPLTWIDAEVSLSSQVIEHRILGFYDENGNKLDGGLGSGKKGYVKITFNPGSVTSESYSITVNGEKYQFNLWYSDFSITGKQIVIGEEYYIVACVENKGYLRGCYNLIAKNGETKIYTAKIDLDYGEVKYINIPLEGYSEETSSSLVTLTIDAASELSLVNNTAAINISTNLENDINMSNLKVWMSSTSAILIRDDIKDIVFKFDENYTLVGTSIEGLMYTVNGNEVVICGENVADLFENGVSEIVFNFVDNSGNEKIGTMEIEIIDSKLSYGFKHDEDGIRYYYEDGSYAKGWQTIDGKTYRFDGQGILFEGESLVYGSQTFWFDADHAALEGLVLDADGYRFYIGGVRQYAWQDTDGDGKKDSYFYVSSYLRCEVDRMLFDGIDSRRFYKYNAETGHMEVVSGFYTNENGTQYFKNGIGRYGWITPDGEIITNKPGITLSGVYYFAYGDGINYYRVEDASKTIGGVTRVFDEDHLVTAYTGWTVNKITGNSNYYVNGALQQGWFETPDGWVYLSRSENLANNITYGDAITGWKKIGGKVYYFRSASSTPACIIISDPERALTYDGVRSTYKINQTPANGSTLVGSDFYITNPPAGI